MKLDPNIESYDDFLILYYNNDDDGILKCVSYQDLKLYFQDKMKDATDLFASASQKGMSVFNKCFNEIECENGQLTFSYLTNSPVFVPENYSYETISNYCLSYRFNSLDDYYKYLIKMLNDHTITEDEFDAYLEWIKSKLN